MGLSLVEYIIYSKTKLYIIGSPLVVVSSSLPLEPSLSCHRLKNFKLWDSTTKGFDSIEVFHYFLSAISASIPVSAKNSCP